MPTDHDLLTQLRARFSALLKTVEGMQQGVTADRDRFLRTDSFDVQHKEIQKRVDELLDRVSNLETWQSRLIGIATAFVIISGILGALVGHMFK